MTEKIAYHGGAVFVGTHIHNLTQSLYTHMCVCGGVQLSKHHTVTLQLLPHFCVFTQKCRCSTTVRKHSSATLPYCYTTLGFPQNDFGEIQVCWSYGKLRALYWLFCKPSAFFFLLLQHYLSFGQDTSKQISLYRSLYREPLTTVGLYFNRTINMYWQNAKPMSYEETGKTTS